MPIQNGKYVAPTWVNGAAPAIDATELQAMSDSIQNRNGGVKTELARFTTSNNWTVPQGVQQVDVYVVGGGGSGYNHATTGSSSNSGCGGGGGYCKLYKNISVTPGSNIPVVVGAGGSVTDGVMGGSAGGTSYFNSSAYSAAGGSGGLLYASGGGAGGSGGGGYNHGGGWGGRDGYGGNDGGAGGGNIEYDPINPYDGIMYGCGGAGAASDDPGGGACSSSVVGIGAGGWGANSGHDGFVDGGVGGGGGGGGYRNSSSIKLAGKGGDGIVIIYG